MLHFVLFTPTPRYVLHEVPTLLLESLEHSATVTLQKIPFMVAERTRGNRLVDSFKAGIAIR